MAADVPFEVVPGITSAIGAPAYAGIPLTQRGVASTLTIVAGSKPPDQEGGLVDWELLAKSRGTLSVLMGWENLPAIVKALIDGGRAEDTPAAVVQWGTWSNQRTVVGSLADIAERARREGLSNPVVVVVGEVVNLRAASQWFDNRPLFGKRVLVTRSRTQSADLVDLLERAGAEPVEVPTIEIQPVEDSCEVDIKLARLTEYDWVVFTSTNSVEQLFARLDALGWDARRLHGSRVAAIGTATASALSEYGIVADLISRESVSQSLIDGLAEQRVAGTEYTSALERRFRPERLRRGSRRAGCGRPGGDAVQDDSPTFGRGRTTSRGAGIGRGCRDIYEFVDGHQPHRPAGRRRDPVRRCKGSLHRACDRGDRPQGRTERRYSRRGLDGGWTRERDSCTLYAGRVTAMSSFPENRMRRLRATSALRRLVQETRLSVSDLIYPIFVSEKSGGPHEIEPMPGTFQHSLDSLVAEVEAVVELGIPAVLLFGIPAHKDELGSQGYAPNGIIQEAIRAIKQAQPELAVIGDVCMCEYTSHGHCGHLNRRTASVDNDRTLELLAETAVSQADAGADMVAPSAMMDGQVGAIRDALDDNDHENVPIMAYSAKYASSFYGPFRTAAESAPQMGDRKGIPDGPAERETRRCARSSRTFSRARTL